MGARSSHKSLAFTNLTLSLPIVQGFQLENLKFKFFARAAEAK